MSRFSDWLSDAMFERGGRKYRGVNLAKDLDVTESTVSGWLNDVKPPSRSNIQALALHFGTTSRHIYELLGETPPEGLNDTYEIVSGWVLRLSGESQARLLKDLEAGKYGKSSK